MKLLNPQTIPTLKRKKPYWRVNEKGVQVLSKGLVTELKLKEKDKVELMVNEDDPESVRVYFFKSENGFELRRMTGGALGFNSIGLTNSLIKIMDLCIAPDKKKSVALDVKLDPENIDGKTCFRLF